MSDQKSDSKYKNFVLPETEKLKNSPYGIT